MRRATILILFAAFLSFARSPVLAYDQIIGDGLCHQIERYINAVVDFATTTCIAAPDDGDHNRISMIILPSRPLFGVDQAKKGWLLAVIGAAGKVLRSNPKITSGRLVLSDPSLMKQQRGYTDETAFVKELQAKLYVGDLSVEDAYIRLVGSMKPYPYVRK